ncbi:phage holin [Escherichia coli]|uniref:phage holin n=1 Tax=Escherichia coli TaxID=562 RepID=UPI0010CC9AFB|nr:phage holin [Escherichia coli]
MKKKYELVVKGINNYPDKITVTVALEIGGYPSLLLPDVAISLDRVLGSLLFGLLTYLTNLYFKIKEDKRKAARGE